MSGKETHETQRILLESPFSAEALEGWQLLAEQHAEQPLSVADLHQQLHQRVDALAAKRRRSVIWWQRIPVRMAIAASLLMGVAAGSYWLSTQSAQWQGGLAEHVPADAPESLGAAMLDTPVAIAAEDPVAKARPDDTKTAGQTASKALAKPQPLAETQPDRMEGMVMAEAQHEAAPAADLSVAKTEQAIPVAADERKERKEVAASSPVTPAAARSLAAEKSPAENDEVLELSETISTQQMKRISPKQQLTDAMAALNQRRWSQALPLVRQLADKKAKPKQLWSQLLPLLERSDTTAARQLLDQYHWDGQTLRPR